MDIIIRFFYQLRRKRKKRLSHPELTGIFDALRAKQQSCLAGPHNVETIFLGSSHVDYAFNPRYFSERAFNLGTNSQDICSSSQLYTFYSEKLPRLKNVILGLSVFSNGYNLAMTSRNFICDSMHALYGFTYPEYDYSADNLAVCELRKNEKVAKPSLNGFLYPPRIAGDLTTLEERVSGHLRENQRTPDQLQYMDLIHSMSKVYGHRLTFVLMPAREDYRAALPPGSILFQAISERTKKYGDVMLLDYYSTDFFAYDDFYDFDHLSDLGAQKFTQKLKEDFYD